MKLLGGLTGGLGPVPERVRQLEAKAYDEAVEPAGSNSLPISLLLDSMNLLVRKIRL